MDEGARKSPSLTKKEGALWPLLFYVLARFSRPQVGVASLKLVDGLFRANLFDDRLLVAKKAAQ